MPLMRAVGIMDPALIDGHLGGIIGWGIVKAFFEYKFVSLFSLLFGIGLVVQMMRAEQKGRNFAPLFLRRLGVLALLGAIHGFGLWYGDILLIYAILGVPLFLLRKLTPQTLVALSGICVLILVILASGCGSIQVLTTNMESPWSEAATTDNATAPAGFEAMARANFDPANEVWIEAEERAYSEGPWANAQAFRTVTFAFALLFTTFSFGWRVLAMFLLGAALMKLGFFRTERRPWHKRLAMYGLGIGVPLEVVATAGIALRDFGYDWVVLGLSVLHELAAFVLCLGYVGAICLIVQSGALRWLMNVFVSVGRVALSAYLMETIISTAIMYWWGLGWFGSVGRAEQLGLTVAIYAAVAAGCMIWLRFFAIGPFEWLWRTLTYGRLQPMRRA
jgi:uncharacterized protein